MAQETEYRLETLETVLAEFIMQTNRSLSRMERDTADFKEEVRRDREGQQQKDEQRLAEQQQRDEQRLAEQQHKDEQRLAEQQRKEEQRLAEQQHKDEHRLAEQQRKDEQRLVEKQREDEEWKVEKKQMNREWNQKWGEMADKLGTFAEDLAAPNLRRIARELFGCAEIDYYAVRIDKLNPQDRSQTFEFDALLVSGQTVFLLESKFTVRMSYLERMPRLIENFKLSFPEYATYKLVTVFASMSIRPDQVNYLTNLGIYAMVLGEENMELLNFNELRGR